mgnify:CR=1 FL=1
MEQILQDYKVLKSVYKKMYLIIKWQLYYQGLLNNKIC